MHDVRTWSQISTDIQDELDRLAPGRQRDHLMKLLEEADRRYQLAERSK